MQGKLVPLSFTHVFVQLLCCLTMLHPLSPQSLQNGDYCFCADSFGSNGPSVHCTADCSIGEGKCGGIGSHSHNSVYLTTRSYLGCLRDSGRRDLEHRVATKVSIDQCISLCNIRNYQVAG